MFALSGRLTAIIVLVAHAGPAQPRTALKPANATLAEEFLAIQGVRELADGRVLISDSQDKRLVVADFATGRVRSIGRTGSGPGEFQEAGRLLAIGHDSTLFVDAGRGMRWLLLLHDSIVATLPPDHPGLRAAGVQISSSDSAGHVLRSAFASSDRCGTTDSGCLLAVRVGRSDGRSDTVATYRAATVKTTQIMRDGKPFYIVAEQLMGARDQAIMFGDGWIAVVRHTPFRVDWYTPGGQVVDGAAIDSRTPPLDREEMEFQGRHGGPKPTAEIMRMTSWAPTVPAWRPNGLIAGPDGTLLVHRLTWSGDSIPRYDMINRTGALVRSVTVAENQRIMLVTAKAAYLVMTDSDGIQRVSRHPWP